MLKTFWNRSRTNLCNFLDPILLENEYYSEMNDLFYRVGVYIKPNQPSIMSLFADCCVALKNLMDKNYFYWARILFLLIWNWSKICSNEYTRVSSLIISNGLELCRDGVGRYDYLH